MGLFNYKKDIVSKIAEEMPLDEQGRAIIKMTVYDDSSFLSPYSEDEPIISDEVASFINNKKKVVLLSNNIVIQIKSNCIDDREKQIYQRAIHNYYKEENREDFIELAKNRLFAFIMGLIGLITFVLLVVLSNLVTLGVWEEIIDIFGWVFVWEAIDIFFLRRPEIRNDFKTSKALMEATIEYIEIN